jgi:hypothetical protein
LAEDSAPFCSDHNGIREDRSETALFHEAAVFILGSTLRDTSGCHYKAIIQIKQEGASASYELPEPQDANFAMVDFSPDGSSLLLVHNSWRQRRESRNVRITTVTLKTGRMRWQNAWDIFGWGDCDATVEPEGFLGDGKVLIRARPSVAYGHPRPNCVSSAGLYATDLLSPGVTHLPDTTSIQRYGKLIEGPSATCKSDPDLVGACFTIHGRLFIANGGPSARIWKIGTDRILGVDNEILPGLLNLNMNFDEEAYGDFYVCPFTRERSGEMQKVCIESASRVRYKRVP